MAGFWKSFFGLEGVMEKCLGCFLVYLFEVFLIKNRGMCDNLKKHIVTLFISQEWVYRKSFHWVAAKHITVIIFFSFLRRNFATI